MRRKVGRGRVLKKGKREGEEGREELEQGKEGM